MDPLQTYNNKEVVVLGLARSGRAVARIFHELGAKVIVSDLKARELCPEADELEQLGIPVICGHHPDDLIHSEVALLVKNPGIPYHAKPIVQALELGIEVVSEIEVAHHLHRGRLIGITGSNGKTTTTTWLAHILESAGFNPLVAGNIGTPLCEVAAEASAGQWLVVELSSFQLKGTSAFRAHIACLLNISETHMDYHGTMADYVAAKQQLLDQQTADDIAVINWDDDMCRSMARQAKGKVIPFSMRQTLAHGAMIEDDWLVYRAEGARESQRVIKTSDIGIPGAFNIENALAVTAIAMAIGIDIQVVAKHLQYFHGVEHRLEFVKTWHGIQFYNNSKSTNVSSTVKALQAFSQPVILIAGGQDRHSTFEELGEALGRHVKGLVAIGETKEALLQIGMEARIPFVYRVHTDEGDPERVMAEAVARAYEIAEPGDVILLSPACASWDMFSSFEERGSMFKQAVHTLK